MICDMRQASFGASFGCRKLLSVASRYAEKLATERGHDVGVWSDLSSKYMAAFAPDHVRTLYPDAIMPEFSER